MDVNVSLINDASIVLTSLSGVAVCLDDCVGKMLFSVVEKSVGDLVVATSGNTGALRLISVDSLDCTSGIVTDGIGLDTMPVDVARLGNSVDKMLVWEEVMTSVTIARLCIST